MMVIEGASGKVLGDILNTPGVHGAGIATKAGHGFTTNGGDKTVTMFDLKSLAEIKRITVSQGGLDGITYDEPDDLIILTNHSRPIGTLTALDPKTGDIVGNVELGGMERWVRFFADTMGFTQLVHFDDQKVTTSTLPVLFAFIFFSVSASMVSNLTGSEVILVI